MARERNSGAGASLIGMVVFGFLFFISLILAILAYSNLGEAQRNAEDAQAKLRRYATQAEEAAVRGRLEDRTPVVKQLLDELETMRRWIAGDANQSLTDIQKRMEALNIDFANGTLQAIRVLQADKSANDELIEELKANLAAANEQKETIAAENLALEQATQARVAELEGQIAQLRTENESYMQRITAMRTELEGVLNETQEENLARFLAYDTQLEALQKENAELLAKLAPERTTIAVDPQRQPDGRIVSILSEDNLVTINLGARDRLPVGITFEVFDHVTGVIVDEDEEVRGKATIEVVNVHETSSVARVVQVERGAVIHEKDLLVNVVYDRNRVHKFTVFGDFDLDGSGSATQSDSRRVNAMIRNWGGKIVEELSYDTDFLVLGLEPTMPDPLDPTIIDPVVIAEHAAAVEKFNRYQELRGQADRMQVPVLNQNRFLYLVGYYTRY